LCKISYINIDTKSIKRIYVKFQIILQNFIR